mgnify:CR=1 FL=1
MINKNYLVNSSTVVTAGAVGAYNELLQYKVQKHQMQWHPLLGQGSDLAAGVAYIVHRAFAQNSLETKIQPKSL